MITSCSPAPGEGSASADVATASETAVTEVRQRSDSERVVLLELTDTSRQTIPVNLPATAAAQRDLPTTVLLPPETSPAPVVVFAHGLGSHPWDFLPLLQAWVDAGYVVVAPRFPLTSSDNPEHNTEVHDLASQPGDVTFVLDWILEANTQPASPLFAAMQPENIGIAGWSLGGATAYGLLFEPCCVDPRLMAGVILASTDLLQTGDSNFTRPMPMLVLHGDADEQLDYRYGRWTFADLAGPARFITLLGATHNPPYQAEPSAWDGVVTDSTIAFWQATLDGDPDGVGRMIDAVERAGDLASSDVRWQAPGN
jgi:dienelactone hydrolase